MATQASGEAADQCIDVSKLPSSDMLRAMRAAIPDLDHACIRKAEKVTSHTGCLEISRQPETEPFKLQCFSLIGGTTF